MNDSQIQEITEKIDSEIIKTESKIIDYRDQCKPIAPDVAIGRISRMDAINNKSVAEAALRQAEERLKNLVNMKTKVGMKEFGVCAKCESEIPFGRMIFRPESRLCVNCAN
jgi:DnaK suppressor protein